MKTTAIIVLFMLFFPVMLHAQGAYTLRIIDLETNHELAYKISDKYESPQTRDKAVRDMVQTIMENGYLALSVDSAAKDSLNTTLYINKGVRYRWASLQFTASDSEFLSKSGFREKHFNRRYVSTTTYTRLRRNILKTCENNGYPFAAIETDSISIQNDSIVLKLRIETGQRILYDSIIITSPVIHSSYLNRYLGISKGMPYNEERIAQTDSKLKELGFLTIKSPTTVAFGPGACTLTINPVKRKTGTFDGILGIAPDNITGKTVLSGDIKLKLVNSFTYGETLEFNWKRPAGTSQRLKAGFIYPYVLGSKLGTAYTLDILQQDTTYVSVRHKGQLLYMYEGFDYISFSGDILQSSLLNTAGFSQIQILPPYAGVRSYLLGTGFYKEKLDFRLNPSRGYNAHIELAGGQRHIEKHPLLDESLYDSITLSSAQYRMSIDAAAYLNPVGRHVLKLGINGGHLSGKSLFSNELYLLGGSKLLRGFDEEAITASLYAVMTLEYRYLIGPLSYISVFGDGCYYENKSTGTNITDRPIGIGTGFTFETRGGIFSISYALGRQFNNPIELKSGKVHIGYVNYF